MLVLALTVLAHYQHTAVGQFQRINVAAVVAVTLVLAMPDNFDPEANMLINRSGLHSVRDTMNHAARLVAQGGPEDLELAGRMIDAVIQCQERRPDDANYGNFLW